MYFKPIISFRRFISNSCRILMLFTMITLTATVFAVNEIRTVGNVGANYATLKAAFDAINAGTLTGNVTLRIISNTTETTTATLNSTGFGANYSSVNIYPTAIGISVSGNIDAPLIDLNGADNVIFDGRVNATGFAKSLTIINSSTSSNTGTSTIRFANDAVSNTIKYCIIKGSQTNPTTGVVFFSTSTGVVGNDNNTLTINDITNSSDVNRPLNAIYSEGSPNRENNNNVISNNNIFDFLNRSANSIGINISANSNAFDILNNSLYETTNFVPSSPVTYSIIYISNTFGSGFKVMNNFIGGTAELCSGNAWTKTNAFNNAFNGIYVAVGTDAVTQVQGNKISNLIWNNVNGGNWIGIIAQSGDVNIGTTAANSIGGLTGTASIVYSLTSVGGFMCPIQINSSELVNCSFNNIGSLFVNNSNRTICIFKNSGSGITTISNNRIGSTNTVNSIEVSANPIGATQFLTAIQVQGFQSNIVSSNTISNLTANSTGTGFVRGIEILSGTNVVSDNVISNIKTSCSNAISLCGLSFTNSSNDNVIAGNIISDLENNNNLYNGSIIGMTLQCSGDNSVYKNFIYELRVSASTNNASLYGVRTETGTATYSNNIIRLGGNTSSTIYGIYESGSQTCNLYHNTIYIDGEPVSGARRSYALYSATNSNTIDYVNNLFVNSRSNNGATGNHYSAFFNYATAGSLTLNHNVYYANGIDGFIGNFANINISDLPIIAGQDINSLKIDPGFLNAGGNGTSDYKLIYTKLNGEAGTGVIDDFGGNPRSGAPTIGAWEFTGDNMWKGNLSTDWGNPLNWTLASVPASGSDIKFDPYPLNHLVMDANRTVNGIYNHQATYRLALNGKRLMMLGGLFLTNGAQIDASATNSMLEFAGSDVQNIYTGCLYNNEAYNIRVNNIDNVVLSGTLVLLNQLTASGGRLDATTNSPSVIYRGNASQTILNFTYLNNGIYDLTIDNSVGVALNTTMDITNNLTINNGKIFTISPIARLKVDNQIVNNAGVTGLIINSTSVGTGALIHNTSNVPATSKRYIGGASTAWHFLSSPVSNQALSVDWKPAGTYADGTGYDLYAWHEPSNCWIYNLNTTVAPTWNTVNPSANFIAGKGYLYALQAVNTTKQFVGLLNNGDVNFTMSNLGTGFHKGFNFVGNPYASSIDWKNDAGFTRDMLALNGGGYDIWIWSSTANNYGVYNSADPTNDGTNNISRYISPNMGFFVKANSTGTFVFKNAGRVYNEVGNWIRVKRSSEILNSISFSVVSADSLGSDEVKLIVGSEQTLPGATKMFSQVKTAPSLFIKSEESAFSTYYFEDLAALKSLDISFKAGKNGIYTFVPGTEMEKFTTLLLEDKLTGKIVNLKEKEKYLFKSNINDVEARFTIHFSDEFSRTNALDIVEVYSENKNAIIDLRDVEGEFYIKLFDSKGSEIFATNAVGGELKSIPLKSNPVVIIKIFNKEKSKSFKLLN